MVKKPIKKIMVKIFFFEVHNLFFQFLILKVVNKIININYLEVGHRKRVHL